MSLADAIIEEDVIAVREHLRYGVNVNDIDEYGFTPLIEAAITDNLEMAALLIQAGADVNAKDMTGGTALHWAAENNNLKLAALLLQQRADANAYNFAGQPVLVMPLLRQQAQMKQLLMEHGAFLDFAQDYVNTKLLGHMYELVGTADIVDPRNNFIEVDFEGFFLEVTLAIITESLDQFQNHYAARQLRRYMNFSHVMVEALARAARLIRFQQYRVNTKKYQQEILALVKQEPLIIPVGYEGHAITFIKFGNIFVKCDRREDSRLFDNIMIYQMQRPQMLDADFVQRLLFEKMSDEFVNEDLPDLLQLVPITEIKVTAQISGNCSWANVEACIPAIFFLLISQMSEENDVSRNKNIALNFFQQWREWNKDRSLQFCVQSFNHADPIRKACKAEILAAILFQCCTGGHPKDDERAGLILSVLMQPDYEYVLRNYVRSYCYEDQSEEGKRFMQLLRKHEFKF